MAWRERVRVRVDHSPGQIRGRPEDVAVDQIANAPEHLADRGKDRRAVEEPPEWNLLAPAHHEQCEQDGADGSVEGHSAFPRGNDSPGLRDERLQRLLDDVEETPANDSGDDTGTKNRPNLVVGNTSRPDVRERDLDTRDDADDVHQSIPANGQRPKLNQDRIDVQNDGCDHSRYTWWKICCDHDTRFASDA